MTHILN